MNAQDNIIWFSNLIISDQLELYLQSWLMRPFIMEPGGSCLGQEWDHSALGFAFDEVCWCESDFSSNRHEVMSPTLKMCFFLQRAESLAGELMYIWVHFTNSLYYLCDCEHLGAGAGLVLNHSCIPHPTWHELCDMKNSVFSQLKRNSYQPLVDYNNSDTCNGKRERMEHYSRGRYHLFISSCK